MEHTRPLPSNMFVTPFLILLPPMDALLLLLISSCLLNIFSPAFRKRCILWNSWIIAMKRNFITTKPRLCFSILFLESYKELFHHANHDFDTETLETFKNFFQGHYDSEPPNKTNVCENKDQAYWQFISSFFTCDGVGNVTPTFNNHLVILRTALGILLWSITTALHNFTRHVVSLKKPVLLIGLIIWFKIISQVSKLQKILTCYVKLSIHPNYVPHHPHQVAVSFCSQAAIKHLTQPITLTRIKILHTIAAALAATHAVVIATKMTIASDALLPHTMASIFWLAQFSIWHKVPIWWLWKWLTMVPLLPTTIILQIFGKNFVFCQN